MPLLQQYPAEATIDGVVYRCERVLKDDFFSVNVLYAGPEDRRFVLKLSDFRFLFGLLLRPLAALMSAHEYRIYQRLCGLEGIPQLGPRFGWRGYFHEFVPGRTLHEWDRGDELPADFFDRLAQLLGRIHQRRIYYLDGNKEGNIIVGVDGRPWLIDFQISMHFPQRRGRFGRFCEDWFQRLIAEDIYHVYKHKRRYQPQLLSGPQSSLATRSRFARRYNRWLGRPWRALKRRIYPSGSNEIIWYKWKRMKDRERRSS